MIDKLEWQKMSLAQQMGNIGSEVSKSFYWKDKNNEKSKQIVDTTLELFDATIEDKRRRFELTEIIKMRAVFCDTFFNLGNFDVSPESINKYFIPFAIRANQ